MINQDRIHKLCKYGIRLKKSLNDNNVVDYNKYCSHLKYHIRNQIGSSSNPELERIFDTLTNYINDNEMLNVETLKTKLDDANKKLEESNSTENIIFKLEKLHNDKYGKFIDLLEQLFTKIYSNSVVAAIINKIKLAESEKNNPHQLISNLEHLNTNESIELKNRIINYLDNDVGDINSLKTEYNNILSKIISQKINHLKKGTNKTLSTLIPPNYTSVPL